MEDNTTNMEQEEEKEVSVTEVPDGDGIREDAAQNRDDSPQKENGEETHKLRNAIVEFVIYALVVVLCIFFVPRYVIQRTIVDGDSMQNTLQNEDNLLVEKVSYHFTDPKRFDVIVFYPYGKEEGSYYIKRIIGLPGEKVQITDNKIYINDKLLKENYGADAMNTGGIAEDGITLGKDEYFVLGDHRSISEDSRYEEVGPVSRDKIAGKAILRIYPFKEFGTFQ